MRHIKKRELLVLHHDHRRLNSSTPISNSGSYWPFYSHLSWKTHCFFEGGGRPWPGGRTGPGSFGLSSYQNTKSTNLNDELITVAMPITASATAVTGSLTSSFKAATPNAQFLIRVAVSSMTCLVVSASSLSGSPSGRSNSWTSIIISTMYIGKLVTTSQIPTNRLVSTRGKPNFQPTIRLQARNIALLSSSPHT